MRLVWLNLINRFLDVIFYLAGSANGYDKYGHYVRTRLVLEENDASSPGVS